MSRNWNLGQDHNIKIANKSLKMWKSSRSPRTAIIVIFLDENENIINSKSLSFFVSCIQKTKNEIT